MFSDIYIHNTLTGKKEKFVPIKSGEVKMYSCGPTVYDFAHIGNFRSFLMSDLLVRVLRYAGYEVKKIQNITDVGHLVSDSDEGEDKIMKKARLEKKDPFAIARFFEEAFVEDETKLRIVPPDSRPKATEFIPGQIKWCEKLIKEGIAYESNGSIYFRISTFLGYGSLSKNRLEDLIAGARVEKNPEKESPLDFALWKRAGENHLMQWDSPWGRGFPGWHLECSVMSHSLLSFPFDIHTGGEDNIFPHHECEIAQNEAYFGKKTVNYWVHAKHLMVDGKKMAKSDGNFFTVRDLFEKGYCGVEIRYLLLSAHYRTAMNFTFEGLAMAKKSIERLEEARRVFSKVGGVGEAGTQPLSRSLLIKKERDRFRVALFDDLNAADALAAVFDLIKEGMKLRDEGKLISSQAAEIVQFLNDDFDQIFDVFPKKRKLAADEIREIEERIVKRDQCRNEKNWGEADRIRGELLEKGIELVDEEGKTVFKIKN